MRGPVKGRSGVVRDTGSRGSALHASCGLPMTLAKVAGSVS